MKPEQDGGVLRNREDRLLDDGVDYGLGRRAASGVKPDSKILLPLSFRLRQTHAMDGEGEGKGSNNGGRDDIAGVGPSIRPHRSQHSELGVKIRDIEKERGSERVVEDFEKMSSDERESERKLTKSLHYIGKGKEALSKREMCPKLHAICCSCIHCSSRRTLSLVYTYKYTYSVRKHV